MLQTQNAVHQVPLWLLWARALCVVLSVAGAALHYYLKTHDRLKIKHAVKRFYIAAARENRLETVKRAAAMARRGFERIYGQSWLRIAAISACLSLFYFVCAFFMAHGLRADWQGVRATKRSLERAAEPDFYALPPIERKRALEMDPCINGAIPCGYTHHDPAAKRIQEQAARFELNYPKLVAQNPRHSAVTMLTMWEGTVGSKPPLLGLASLLMLNILLDLGGILMTMKTLSRLSDPSYSLMSMLGFSAISGITSIALGCLSFYGYGLVDRGDVDGVQAFFIFALGLGYSALGVAAFVWLVTGKDGRLVPLFVTFFFSVPAVGLIMYALPHFVSVHIPVLRSGDPLNRYFYFIALATVLPGLVGSTLVIAISLAGVFARTLIMPTLVYLRIVFRMPGPLLGTFTAAPAIVMSAVVSNWTDLRRMLGAP